MKSKQAELYAEDELEILELKIAALRLWDPNKPDWKLYHFFEVEELLELGHIYFTSMDKFDRGFYANIRRIQTLTPKQRFKLLTVLNTAIKNRDKRQAATRKGYSKWLPKENV